MYRPNDNRLWLFSSEQLSAVLHGRLKAIEQHISALKGDDLNLREDDDLVEEIESRVSIAPLEFDAPNATMQHNDTTVDVSRNPNYMIPRGHSPKVPGVEVRISVPYKGDARLWRCQPNSFKSIFPRGEVHESSRGSRSGVLDVVFVTAGSPDPEWLKREWQTSLELIQFYISSQKTQIAQEQSQLIAHIRRVISAKRSRIKGISDFSAALGIPVVPKQTITTIPHSDDEAIEVIGSARRAVSSTREWDVFISHASEDKNDFVRPLATALQKSGLKVWYDEFSLTIGDSLRRKIDEGLAKSRFGIVVISPAFLKKEWPQRELDGLTAREINGQKVILPIWHNVNYEDVVAYSPTLADRLAASSAKDLTTIVQQIVTAVGGH